MRTPIVPPWCLYTKGPRTREQFLALGYHIWNDPGSIRHRYTLDVSAELIGILGVGVTLLVGLGGLLLALWSRTDKRLDRMSGRLDGVVTELRRLGERVARLEALAQIRPADTPATGH